MNNYRIRNIVWDWNGTLLDDMDLCIDCINILLRERSLPGLSPGYYREVFTFPIREYFLKIGFDFSKEPFEQPADKFVLLYNQKYTEAGLFSQARQSLQQFREQGFRQFILSAQEQELLNRLLKHYGISEFFEAATGTTDNYAYSKAGAGKQMMDRLGLDMDETILIGDTIHDFEVAKSLGIQCLLLSHGHQSPTRLASTRVPVLESYADIKDHLNNR
jgi:phosphoglycolate phosphatase